VITQVTGFSTHCMRMSAVQAAFKQQQQQQQQQV
jgi:hypothetical protein